MKLEIRVPISPTDFFFRRVRYLQRSLINGGSVTARARIVVSVGDPSEPFDITAAQPWSRETVEWRWVDKEAFGRWNFIATYLDRVLVRSDADLVLFADADTIFTASIDDLLAALTTTPAIAGIIAHQPPFMSRPQTSWASIFDLAGLAFPQDLHEQNGWDLLFNNPAQRFSPAYFNFGLLFVPGSWLSRLANAIYEAIPTADEVDLDQKYYVVQLALTIAIYRLRLPRLALRLRYNYPNIPSYDQRYPEELRDVRILHYLRSDIVHRDRDFSSPRALEALIARRDLDGSNEVLRRTLEKLYVAEHDHGQS